jgi:hypothetical protein
VKVTVIQGGGVAGMVLTSAVDTRRLSPDAERELRKRVEQAGPALSQPHRPQSPAPDAQSVRVEVEDDDGKVHGTNVGGGVGSPELRGLIDWVSNWPGREEQVQPPG